MSIVFSSTKRIRGLRQHEKGSHIISSVPAGETSVESANLVSGELTYDGMVSTGYMNGQLSIFESVVKAGHSITVLNDVASLDSNGLFSCQSAGYAELLLNFPTNSYVVQHFCSSLGALRAKPKSYAVGSLGAHVLTEMSVLVSGHTAGRTEQKLWTITSNNIDAPVGEMNAGLFASAYNWNACSMLTEGRGNDASPMVLISSRHALTANHTNLGVGKKVVFKKPDGTYQTVTTTKSDQVPHPSGGLIDLRILYFDVEVTGITPYKLVPDDWCTRYVPSSLTSAAPYFPTCQLPVLIKGMHDQAGDWCSFVGVHSLAAPYVISLNAAICSAEKSGHAALNDWSPAAFIGGDSGSPIFFPINGELVLLGLIVSAGGSYSHLYQGVGEQLRLLMNSQAGTVDVWAPTYADFGATGMNFTDFS